MLLKLCYGILFIDILIVEYTQQQQTLLSSFGHRILLDLNNTAYLSTLFIGAVLGGKRGKRKKRKHKYYCQGSAKLLNILSEFDGQ